MEMSSPGCGDTTGMTLAETKVSMPAFFLTLDAHPAAMLRRPPVLTEGGDGGREQKVIIIKLEDKLYSIQ